MGKRLEYSYPEKEGIDSRLIINFLNEAEKAGGEIHGIMILVHGKVIFEAYNEPYRADIPHIMHSFTKCLTNTAVGLAYTYGLLKLDDPILQYFPEYSEYANEYLKHATIRNLITMRSGQERSIGGNEWRPLKSSWLEAYFRVPFDKEPGSQYMYSSGNSYILSAIVQRLTGETCREYLWEHVTSQIGTRDFDWMLSPEGICSGGNGISLTVEDMARIGLLYLNHGAWNGQQLLSREWIELSLGLKEPVDSEKNVPEYNFHWEHAGDIWAAKGMFGQICALVPSMDMVVACTAADAGYVLSDILQKEVLDKAKENRRLNEASWEILKNKGLRMTLKGKNVSVPNHVIPKKSSYEFSLDGTIDNITQIRIRFEKDSVVYAITDERGFHEVRAGLDFWIDGATSMTGAYLHHQYEVPSARISACAYWSDEKTLMMEWRYPEMAFFDHLSIHWESDTIHINRWVNMNSQGLSRPEIVVTC